VILPSRLASVVYLGIAILATTGGVASANFSPAGTAFTLNATGSVTFTFGNISVSCTTSVWKGNTANPLSSELSIAGGGATLEFNQIGGCPATVGGLTIGTGAFDTHGTWDIVADDPVAGSARLRITVPDNALSLTLTPTIGPDCVLTLNASSMNDVLNLFTNATKSLVINDTTLSWTSNMAPCPMGGTTGTLTAQFSVLGGIGVT
jgi:hypothetical protein